MRKNYAFAIFFALVCVTWGWSQTTVSYTQQSSSYNAIFPDPSDGNGGSFNNGGTELGMYANGGSGGDKQAVAWKTFTDDGTTGGTPTTMNVGDTFQISLSAYRAFGQIGISLLASPSSTSSWSDRINNYALQVNLPGNSGAFDPWEIISNGGTTNASSINGSNSGTINEFTFTFTLISTNLMEVVVERTNNTATSYTQIVRLNNTGITGYAIYHEDDWDGDSNENIFWKQTTQYVYANVWDGSTDNDWTDGDNWSTGAAPTASSNVRIPAVTNMPTASSAVTVNDVFVESGASLIAQSTFAGTVHYSRNLGSTNWYLVGSPVNGETIEDMISHNLFASGTGSNIGLAPYDNTQAVAADRWDYQTSASTGSLTSGGGYSVKLSATGDLTFIGSMEVADVGVSITSGAGNAFNLVGNPYTSFIAANSNADGTNNLLSVNTADLTENTLWLWDQSANTGAGGYTQYNQASGALYIAPGQGFFVSSSGSNTFDFTEAMQSHQTTDTFRSSTTSRPEIQLEMTDGTSVMTSDIYYIDGTTTGFDNGFDSSIFGGVNRSFELYTQAVANGNGRKFGIQSLPDNNFENMIIPVGVKASSGSTITISANALNLPSGIKVFLEDNSDNTFTELDGSSDFTTTLTSDLDGVGRFFLRTTSQALSADEVNFDNISMYTTNPRNLRVVGVQNGNAQVRMFNILGKQVMNTSFTGNGMNDVSLPSLSSGVYIIQLETETGQLNKKVIIE